MRPHVTGPMLQEHELVFYDVEKGPIKQAYCACSRMAALSSVAILHMLTAHIFNAGHGLLWPPN